MKGTKRIALTGVLGWVALSGCGGHVSPTNTGESNACAAGSITGTLRDSLTGRLIADGQVLLETGSPVPGANEDTSAVAQQAVSGADGSFAVCAAAAGSPAAIVVAALDPAGNSYPAFVTAVSAAVDLGALAIGGCVIECGLDGQQQSSAPATIEATVTTDPLPEPVSVTLEYVVQAPDGSGALWDLIIPTLNQQSFAPATAANGCPGVSGVCAAFRFVLPSLKPVVAQKGANVQLRGSPVYAVAATIGAGHTCTPPVLLTNFEQDGSTPLTAVPGAVLSAAPLAFHACT